MTKAGGVYSWLVAWLKIVLPLAALALLSTLFLLSRSGEPLVNTPFADAIASGETVGQQVGAPFFAGTTRRGEMLTMTARSARPGPDDTILAVDLEATLTQADGATLRLDAANASLRDIDQEVTLAGGVRIESSTGYTVTSETLVTDLNDTRAHTPGPVRGEGPVGTLEAGRLQIGPVDDAESGDVQLLFTDGVKLIYLPRTASE